ncbi:hypothetical protein C0993_007267 [Termitomyces sp. T159_Od127]|nr:hypothetical protein C0993_007267 [Termitomyces sp. T159_Od127]
MDTIRRSPHRDPVSRQNSTFPLHQHKPNGKITSKVSHRFVEIHHKTWSLPSLPGTMRNREYFTRVFASRTTKPSNSKHEAFAAKSEYLAGGEVTAVPNPIPDTGFRPHPSPSSIHVAGPTASHSQLVHSVPLSQTALPILSSSDPLSRTLGYKDLTPTPSFPTFLPVATGYANGSSVGEAEIHPTNATAQSRKLSIPLIVLLAVGCALIFIGIFSLIKYYSRPTRRLRPRPSLPVLDDPFADDKELALEDSPIFGGKERTSNGIWSWSHYPQPGIVISKPPSIAQPDISAGSRLYGSDSLTRSPGLQERPSDSALNWRPQSAYSGHGHTQSVPTVTSGNSPFHASLQQLQGALSRTATRMSAASASLYLSSPRNHSNIGLAITRSPMTTLTADGSNVLKRTGPKTVLDKRRSNSAAEAAKDPVSANDHNSPGSSYTASEISSPSFLPYTTPQREACVGRSRIKSSYYNVNAYPRISNPALASTSKSQGTGSESPRNLRKSEARRDRNTQALTRALGLSPLPSGYAPPSPQPTLYPEDSLSVVDAKRPRKPEMSSHKRQITGKAKEDDHRPSLPVISTAMDASAALGSLMLMDFAGNTTRLDDLSNKRLSVTSLNKVPSGGMGAKSSQSSLLVKTSSSKRNSLKSTDKPPSIPLPELLPSLEQMGLEHANPQAYADYRSPTYSIYGLYGGDRKSGAGY